MKSSIFFWLMGNKRGSWQRYIFILLTMLAALVMTGTAKAADFRGGDRIVVAEDEVIEDDLFITGNYVEINGTVTGDVFASGNVVVMNGAVEGSLFIGTNTAVINGPVNGSVYTGGYSLTVGESAEIGRNLYFGGFSVNMETGSRIARSLYASGYQTIINGSVAGDVVANSAALVLNGDVGGEVRGEVAAQGEEVPGFTRFMPTFGEGVLVVPPGLRVSDEATIGGGVNVSETAPAADSGTSLAESVADRVGEFIALLLVGALWLYLAPALLARAGNVVQARPLPSAGWGCLILLLFPVLVMVALVLLIVLIALLGLLTSGQLTLELIGLGGGGLALFVAAFGLAFSILTKVIIAYLVGRLILRQFSAGMKDNRWRHFWSLALGAAIYEIARLIPFLGGLIAILVILLGLGSLFLAIRGGQPMEPAAVPAKVVET